MGRRNDVIEAATDVLRTQGPDALTSVNVAAALGVTQPAIYRHVRDMDELTALAAHRVVAELADVMSAAVSSPETTWGDGTHVARFAGRVVTLIALHPEAFATVDRWRFHDGELGEGVRALLAGGAVLIADELERNWRDDFGWHAPFDESVRQIQLAHAAIVIDDVNAVARSVRHADVASRGEIEQVLALRLFAGWCAYVLHLNHLVGLPTPQLGGVHLSPPSHPIR